MEDFIEKFNGINNLNGFYDFTPYSDGVGFSIKKDLNNNDIKNTSLLKFYIKKDEEYQKTKRPIIISVTYGEKADGGVSVRNSYEVSSPVDLSSNDEYYYDTNNKKLFKGNREISGCDFINEIYEKHIKPMKPIRGFWFRAKMFFCRIVFSKFFNFLSTIFHFCLYVLTGDNYTFEAIMGKEVLNNKIIKHIFKELIGKEDDNDKSLEFKEENNESEKFNFFGYQTSYWVIRSYSIIIILFFMIFEYYNWENLWLTKIFKNNLLLLCFVVLSLWCIEGIIPMILKKIIKKCSMISANFAYRRIKI